MNELVRMNVELHLLQELKGDSKGEIYPAALLRSYKSKVGEIAKRLADDYNLTIQDIIGEELIDG